MSRFGIIAALSLVLSALAPYHCTAAAAAVAPAQAKVSIPGINTSTVKHFDCPKATTCSKLSHDQLQAAMEDFANLLYTQKDITTAFDKYIASNYVQHNPDILDGKEAAIKALSGLFASPNASLKIARVMVGPEYTTIHIRANLGNGQGDQSVMDVYRTQGSCIVEHWDCIQAVANNTVNPHPYF